MTMLLVFLFIVIILETIGILRLNKACEEWEEDYDRLKRSYDLLAEAKRQLKRELDIQLETNKVEASLKKTEKVSKPRGRKPKAKKEEKK